MSAATLLEIKKALVGCGLEIYRTRGAEVQLADRVRDNLILDSGVSVSLSTGGERYLIRFVVRAQKSDFPHDRPDVLFDQARGLAFTATQREFAEVRSQITPVTDPVDPTRTLDTWFEVLFEKAVDTLGDAVTEARFALGLEKYARPVDG